MRAKYYEGDIVLVLNKTSAPAIYDGEREYMNLTINEGTKVYVSSFSIEKEYTCGMGGVDLLSYDVWGIDVSSSFIGFKKENIVLWRRPFINWVKYLFS